jgi:hypothetical protein
MAKSFEKLIFGGLHEKHAVQRGIWVTGISLLYFYLLYDTDRKQNKNRRPGDIKKLLSFFFK